MLNLLKIIRYLVFVVVIISNAIVTSVAVWNLSLVEGSMRFSADATVTASYLIAIATMGLLLIFPIVFVEIAGKRAFLGMVWFELVWVGLFGLMTLIGASLITSLGSRELCVPTSIAGSQLVVSPCSSAQVLGVFTWMPASFLLAYMSLLSILAFVRSKEDPIIWKCLVRDMPVDKILGGVNRNSIVVALHQIRKSPVIHAPKPRYIIPPLLDCRSARNSAYDFQPPVMPAKSAPVREMRMSSSQLPSVAQGPSVFYNASVQKAMASRDRSRAPPPPPPVQLRREQTSPPPLGDWPRLDATSRPRTKRYQPAAPRAQGPPVRELPTTPRRPSQRSAPSSAPLFIGPVSPRTSPTRTRPPGSGRLGSAGSMDSGSGSPSQHRPPPLDLSKISTHRTRSQRSQSRAGRGL